MQLKMLLAVPMILASAALAQTVPTVGKPQAKLALGEPAPEIVATDVDGKGTSLAAIRIANNGKILILQFASITDPLFRSRAPAVEKLAAKFADNAVFVILYQREAHGADGPDPLDLNESEGFNLAEPTGIAERQKLAQQAVTRLHLQNQTVAVDTWNNTSSLRYGSYPNMTFVIDAKGNLQAGYPFMDPKKVQSTIETLIAGKELPAELKGSTMRAATSPAPFDFAGAAMDMTGGRGPAGIAAVLDRISLSDSQRAILLPAIADYMADVQTFRQSRQSLPGAPARGPARGAAANRGNAPASEPAKVSTPQDMQATITTLRNSADKLKLVIKQNLNAKDAASLYQSLDMMAPAQRLFSTPGSSR